MIWYQEKAETEQFQEEDSVGRFESGAIRRLSMLHLSPTAASASADKCTACGSGVVSMKRPTFSPLPEPSPKRPTLLHPSSAAAAAAPPPLLCRSLSDPIDSLGFLKTPSPENPQSLSTFSQFLNSLSPANPKIAAAAPPSPATNSATHPLYRSFSDPTAAVEFIPLPQSAATPPRPPAAVQTFKSPPGSADESPNTKQRLKRMKDRLREMRQWWDEVLQEEDEDPHSQDIDNSKEEENQVEQKTSPDESVWVEKAEEGLVIHFKCPCNKGYEILLSGNNCYYKLM